MSTRWQNLLPAAVLLFVFAVHGPGSDGSFHFDDGHSILRNPHIRSLAHLPRLLADPTAFSENPAYAMYRPAVLVTYAVTYAWSGYRVRTYHLTNLLIHGLAVATLYAVARLLGLSLGAALIASLIFGVHPLQSEPVHYISSRSESMAGLCCLASLAAYLRRRGTADSTARAGWLLASLAALALGLLSKTTAAVLPLLLILHDRLLAPGRIRLRTYLPWVGLVGLYGAVHQLLVPQGLAAAAQVRPWIVQLATQLKAVVFYAVRGAVPVHLSVYPQFQAAEVVVSAPVIGAALVLASTVAAGWSLGKRYPWLALALAWPVVCLLPVTLVPLHVLVSDHRLYLALAGPCLILGRAVDRPGMRRAALVACLVLAMHSVQRAAVWRDELTLWKDAVAAGPLVPEAHYNLGYAHHLAGDLVSARASYERAVALSPGYARAQVNLGVLYRQEGRRDAAVQAFTAALKEEPGMVEAMNNLGLVYREQGDLARAEAAFRRAIELRPDLAEAELNLGLTLRDQGDQKAAFEHLQRALLLNPGIREMAPSSGTLPAVKDPPPRLP
ncbi:MAG: tetratricopeptide repeat protein [Candidatus Latescibacterota bacterium]|jgi:Tfp pilus assembly protein PilF